MQDSNLRNLRPKRSGIATNRIREKNPQAVNRRGPC